MKTKKIFLLSLSCILSLGIFGCDNKVEVKDGVAPQLRINVEDNNWEGTYDSTTKVYTNKAKVLTIPRNKNGEYPQTVVTDTGVIRNLDKITETDENGYITYKGEKYLNYTNEEAYSSNDGHTITPGAHYYKVEPINWRILSTDTDNNTITAVSEYVLDNQIINDYYTGVKLRTDYKNETDEVAYSNYKFSYLRSWLNTTFINTAFADDSLVLETEVDNSETSAIEDDGITNAYLCDNTTDKIFLLSRKDAYDNILWKTSYNGLKAVATDYAKAEGCSVVYNNYTLRTPFHSSGRYYAVGIAGNLTVWRDLNCKFGVRPAVCFSTDTE